MLCRAVCAQQIRTLCLSPDGQLLLSIDENGRALLIARTRRVLLHHFSFKGPVAAAAFSPDGRFVAVAVGRLLQVCVGVCSPAGFGVMVTSLCVEEGYGEAGMDAASPQSTLPRPCYKVTGQQRSMCAVCCWLSGRLTCWLLLLLQVWHTPSMSKQLTPMQLHRTYGTCHDTITALDWSQDSQFIAAASKDLTARVYSLNPIPGWTPPTLSGHKAALVGVFFTAAATQDAAALVGQERVVLYTVSKDGALFGWSLQQQQQQLDAGGEEKEEGDQQQQQQQPGLSRGSWVLSARHFFMQRGARLTAADFHKKSGVLVAGG